MLLPISFKKDKSHWLIEVPALDVLTQGKNRRQALAMIADAVEILVDRNDFQVKIKYSKINNLYYLTSNRSDLLVALLLKRQRQKHGITLQEVARRLGSSSPNAFARYEQGKSCPTVTKLQELIVAINPKLLPILGLGIADQTVS